MSECSDFMWRASSLASSSSFAALIVAPHSLQSMTRTGPPPSLAGAGYTERAWKTAVVPFVEREGGVSLFWHEWGDGPGLLVTQSYIQHPEVLEGLLAELQSGHRMVRYDARGAGESTRRGPYDMATDVADLLAVAEAAGPLAAVVANGDASNRAVHAAAQRPDLVPCVVS